MSFSFSFPLFFFSFRFTFRFARIVLMWEGGYIKKHEGLIYGLIQGTSWMANYSGNSFLPVVLEVRLMECCSGREWMGYWDRTSSERRNSESRILKVIWIYEASEFMRNSVQRLLNSETKFEKFQDYVKSLKNQLTDSESSGYWNKLEIVLRILKIGFCSLDFRFWSWNSRVHQNLGFRCQNLSSFQYPCLTASEFNCSKHSTVIFTS